MMGKQERNKVRMGAIAAEYVRLREKRAGCMALLSVECLRCNSVHVCKVNRRYIEMDRTMTVMNRG